MRLTDDFEENNNQTGLPVVFMAVGVMSFIFLLFIVVLVVNQKPGRHKAAVETVQTENEVADAQSDLDSLELGKSTLTSDQLDFWNMYKEDKDGRETINTVSGSSLEEKEKALKEQEEGPDLSEGGTKTKVTLPDGTEQWVMINAYIPKHSYDFVGLVYQEPVMKYYDKGNAISHLGVNLNRNSGDVNFEKLKSAGVEFVMIRFGARGYQNGQISIDDKYATYVQEAREAGLEVGLTFYSQAVTQEEAVEEANTVLGSISANSISYPIVFDMELVSNDTARIDTLSKMTLTNIADAFCKTIKDAGYSPIIYGNKYWLLRKIDLTKLSSYDIWLSQEEDVPDYPYKFSMWEYTREGQIDGISGDASLSISFIDYTMR